MNFRKLLQRLILGGGLALSPPLVLGADSSGQAHPSNGQASLQCWWKSERNAVQFGQPFWLILTCEVADGKTEKIILKENLLEGAGVQFPPFEVVTGVHYPDLQEGSRRWLQYHYVLRLLADGWWGKEIRMPQLELRYQIQYLTDGKEATLGQDKVYLLPAFPIKVFSLLSQETKDIRDAGRSNFGQRQTHLFRASLAGGLAVFSSVLFLVFMFWGLWRWRQSKKIVEAEKPLPIFPARLLWRRLQGELRKVERKRKKEEWGGNLLVRVLTVLRVAGALALDRPVSQTVVEVEVHDLEGQLKLRKGWLRPKKVLVSSELTVETLNRETAVKPQLPVLRELALVFVEFNAVRYGRNQNQEASVLDQKLTEAQEVLKKIRWRRFWLVKKGLFWRERLELWWRRLWKKF